MSNIDYYTTNVLNCKIFDPESYEKKRNSTIFGFSRSSFDRVERNTRHDILNSMSRNINSFRGQEMTTSGQDMSWNTQQRAIHTENCKNNALLSLQKEYIRIIENCKKVLIEYDVLEEFKKYNPIFAYYFDLKETDITWEMISTTGKYGNEIYLNSDLDNFIEKTIKCALSPETNNKRIEKQRKQREIIQKKKNEEIELLYKKEYECMKLFELIEKNKMKSAAIYVEYKKISELKDKYKVDEYTKNTLFLDYFTNEKKTYLNNLLKT